MYFYNNYDQFLSETANHQFHPVNITKIEVYVTIKTNQQQIQEIYLLSRFRWSHKY